MSLYYANINSSPSTPLRSRIIVSAPASAPVPAIATENGDDCTSEWYMLVKSNAKLISAAGNASMLNQSKGRDVNEIKVFTVSKSSRKTINVVTIAITFCSTRARNPKTINAASPCFGLFPLTAYVVRYVRRILFLNYTKGYLRTLCRCELRYPRHTLLQPEYLHAPG